MYTNQRPLRRAAEKALRMKGFKTLVQVGSGGARVAIESGGRKGLALVRTSSDRWVGWMRKDGEWKGFDEAEVIIVSSIDNVQRPRMIEIYAFDPKIVRDAFEKNLAARVAANPRFKVTAPVFVGLDNCKKGKPSSVSSNLSASALWMLKLPIDEADPASAAENTNSPAKTPVETREKFAARVRQEFADLVGVPVDKVGIEFRVSL
jgi:hypothetical protein